MLHSPLLIPPSADFWPQAAQALLAADHGLGAVSRSGVYDFSGCQVIVPAFSHAQHLRAALEKILQRPFIAPRLNTMSGLLAMMPPVSADSERLMQLYGALRQHGWLKKMFAARRNTDLLPLAQTLLSLSDELTQALLPVMQAVPGDADARWQAALEQLSPAARALLSDEAQLVWSIWKTQLGDAGSPEDGDKMAQRYGQMLQLAQRAEAPLIWISPVSPEPLEQAFLEAYAQRQEVQTVVIDWRAAAVPAIYREAWQELCEEQSPAPAFVDDLFGPAPTSPAVSLCPAASLEEAALQSAQTVLAWLAQGKTNIAVVAQDRVVARRLRALLDRAEVAVADETGWKLSTTRAAAALAAWCDVVAGRGETAALLDLLKSPFVFAGLANKAELVMQIEWQLRRRNIDGEWRAILSVFDENSAAADCLGVIARQAAAFGERMTLGQWSGTIRALLDALDMRAALAADIAGQQVLQMLDRLERESDGVTEIFTFPEWRALLNLELDATTFMPAITDRRVVMLPLNGARLRVFDAVLVLGADAEHLPSQPQEMLFFSNAVRSELGLATRASRQRQQLRDLTELLCAHDEVVLCWQSHKDGEPNPVSPWIERLQLRLARGNLPALALHRLSLPLRGLSARPVGMPAPAAPDMLPEKLSASSYNSFVACPYQFFALRMLRVAVMDELSDMPEKRDYGGWLHQILTTYHETLRDQKTPLDQHLSLLTSISDDVFRRALVQHPAALGYAARWNKVMPAYVAWADEREAQGWHFVLGELPMERMLEWDGGGIQLYGRLDRVDEDANGARAVLDYKTRNLPSLSLKLRDAEDHQLAFYGLLSGGEFEAGHYVALETYKDKIGDVPAPEYAHKQQLLQQQISAGMQAVTQGAPLPANGIAAVCQYCEVRGLCRKGVWQ